MLLCERKKRYPRVLNEYIVHHLQEKTIISHHRNNKYMCIARKLIVFFFLFLFSSFQLYCTCFFSTFEYICIAQYFYICGQKFCNLIDRHLIVFSTRDIRGLNPPLPTIELYIYIKSTYMQHTP